MTVQAKAKPLEVVHIARGRVVTGADDLHQTRDLDITFTTPKLDIPATVWARPEPGPAFGLPVKEIIDFLLELAEHMTLDNPIMKEACEKTAIINYLPAGAVEAAYKRIGDFFDKDLIEFEVEQSLRGPQTWETVTQPGSRRMDIRLYPIRLLHFMAGNGPALGALTIIRAALVRSVSVLKLASSDLFTPPAIMATMAAIDPQHPITRSFSAIYWRGGTEPVERALFRNEYFDTVVAWGGASAIRNVQKYIGPGLDLVALNPKVSVSLIGREAFADSAAIDRVAGLAALDVGPQEACRSSRIQYVEGTDNDVDAYCERLLHHLQDLARARAGRPTPDYVVDAVKSPAEFGIRKAIGRHDGTGFVVWSQEPLDMYMIGRTVNVVRVDDLTDALQHLNVESQSVGIYPAARRKAIRDAVFAAGAQNTYELGTNHSGMPHGVPHDGYQLLQRMVRWAVDSD
jgi:hypothetical protein